MNGFIDPPSPFAPVEEWEAFARDMEKIQSTNPAARPLLDEARKMIAELKAQKAA